MLVQLGRSRLRSLAAPYTWWCELGSMWSHFSAVAVQSLQEEKVAEVERELNEAQHRVESAKAVYEVIVRRMSEELARFQRERAAELAGVLRNFAMAQAQLAGDTAKVGANFACFISVLVITGKVPGRVPCTRGCSSLYLCRQGCGVSPGCSDAAAAAILLIAKWRCVLRVQAWRMLAPASNGGAR